ncbi:MAG: hypothetical protein BACD_02540 [Bacteroides rodentium]
MVLLKIRFKSLVACQNWNACCPNRKIYRAIDPIRANATATEQGQPPIYPLAAFICLVCAFFAFVVYFTLNRLKALYEPYRAFTGTYKK